jgi:hypothetical protein
MFKVETCTVGVGKGKTPMREESLRIPAPALKIILSYKRDIIYCDIVEIWSCILKLVNSDNLSFMG